MFWLFSPRPGDLIFLEIFCKGFIKFIMLKTSWGLVNVTQRVHLIAL